MPNMDDRPCFNPLHNAELLPSIYRELRQIAASQMVRLPAGATLQPTALVHEAWLRLGAADLSQWETRAHFFAAAAEAMRHILIDRIRRRAALRHGGQLQRLSLEDVDIPVEVEGDDGLLAVDEVIDKLTVEHPDAAALVKLRCFVGLEIGEAAKVLGIGRATAFRRWAFARAWLLKELKC